MLSQRVRRAGLEQQDADVRVLAQPRGEDAARRACAHDDVVVHVASLPFEIDASILHRARASSRERGWAKHGAEVDRSAGVCFGCGPNEKGLQIRSLPAPDGDGDGVVATWEPQPHHVAAPGVLNGGIVGALLDCHSVAAVYAKTRGPGDHPDGWWATAEYAVKLVRPTPSDAPLELHARVVELTDTEALTEARLESSGKLRATCTARFRRFVPR